MKPPSLPWRFVAWAAVALVVVGGAFTAAVRAATGELPSTDQSVAFLTLALVGVTGWYAFQTHAMVEEMRAARREERQARDQEATRRDLERVERSLRRKRERSEEFATRCIDELRRCARAIDAAGGVGPTPRSVFRELYEILSDSGRFITDDEELKDHVLACAEVAFVASFNDEAMTAERVNGGVVRLNAQSIAGATEHALVAYLTGQERGAWHWSSATGSGDLEYYPRRVEAAAWIRNESRSKESRPPEEMG